MPPIERGAVIEYPALFDFDSYPRPYLKHADISDAFGILHHTVVDRTAEELASVVRN